MGYANPSQQSQAARSTSVGTRRQAWAKYVGMIEPRAQLGEAVPVRYLGSVGAPSRQTEPHGASEAGLRDAKCSGGPGDKRENQ